MRLVLVFTVVVCVRVVWADAAVPAPPPDNSDGSALVERWRQAQNDGDFAAYQSLYAEAFSGVRRSGTRKAVFDRAGWMKDRARMFAKKMTVTVDKLTMAKSSAGLIARFEQMWQSGNYRDAGWKEMTLVRVGDRTLIAREEQLTSRRLGVDGAPTLIVWPASDERLDAAQQELGRLTADLKFINGLKPEPRRGVGLILATCADAEVAAVLETFQALQPLVRSRSGAAGDAIQCPQLDGNEDTHTGWKWPEVRARRVGTATLTLLAWQRDEDEQGDFARNFQETWYTAVLRGGDGALVDVAADGQGDFSWFKSIAEASDGFSVEEHVVDAPCDGASVHKQHHDVWQRRFRVRGGHVETSTVGKRRVETIRCSDDEARALRGEHR